MELLIVDLDEGALNCYVCFVLTFLDFFKDKLDNSRYNAKVLLLDPNSISATHRMSFPASCLTVGQHGRVEALEAP